MIKLKHFLFQMHNSQGTRIGQVQAEDLPQPALTGDPYTPPLQQGPSRAPLPPGS